MRNAEDAPDEVQKGRDATAARPGNGPGVIDQPRHVHLQAVEAAQRLPQQLTTLQGWSRLAGLSISDSFAGSCSSKSASKAQQSTPRAAGLGAARPLQAPSTRGRGTARARVPAAPRSALPRRPCRLAAPAAGHLRMIQGQRHIDEPCRPFDFVRCHLQHLVCDAVQPSLLVMLSLTAATCL
jgi:hypothetical protein